MDAGGDDSGANGGAVARHLIGEKDVLAAITCEYLDETVARKDTAAAMVSLGKVRMTTFRFQFVPDEHEYGRVRTHLLQRGDDEIASFFSVPLGCIASVKKKNSVVEILTKDLRQMSFRFDVVEVTRIFNVLTTYVFPDKIDYLFAFYHRLSASFHDDAELIPRNQDWDVYDETSEWERQGVFENGKWRISHFNKDFKEIETYPELIVVPTAISDVVLRDATAFRSIGRIPSLSWLNKANGATLTRSSQPKVGMSKATSPADESLVAAIAGSSLLRDFLHIIDCRPMTNALANRAKGYGVESTVNYKNCSISFMNIPNIHSMRDSMKRFRTLCQSTTCDNLQWLGNVEDTKWLVYVRQLLKSSLHVVTLLRQGESVLLHCSHGWDRTSQISALAQLILDPYYRTWEGFQVLIEKEWLALGHPFQLRLSHGEKADTQESPIFIQFLDCVWQLLRLYPSYFEFNEGFLLTLADALHSCRFGTFLLDCKKLRKEADLENRTPSVWTWLNGLKSELTEQSFVPNQTLDPPVTGLLKRVVVWESIFLRWSAQPLLQEPPVTTNFFSGNTQRISTWQLPQGTINALNAALTSNFKETQLIQQLLDRIAALEAQVAT
uniref:Myotubularin phosphatase domain-containing protein n=1 Tax=Globisporangium ultimum (strain ATCC 200006 / CBS 805.95 / DAOM BR144) TaxID=431595 RepID=K3X8T7_GLOUD